MLSGGEKWCFHLRMISDDYTYLYLSYSFQQYEYPQSFQYLSFWVLWLEA